MTLKEATSPILDEPTLTVAVHKFRGKDSGRAAVLQTPASSQTPRSPASPRAKRPAVAVLSSSALSKLPPNSSQLSTRDLPGFDFPTLKASDMEKQIEPELQESHRAYRISGDNGRWKLLKEAIVDTEVADSNGNTHTPIIPSGGSNGYHGSQSVDMSKTTIIETSKQLGQGYSHGLPRDSSSDKYFAVPSQGQDGDNTYSGGNYPSPSQGRPCRPWIMVEEEDTQEYPGRRKSSGFLQPIKHLSGKAYINSLQKIFI